MYFCRGRIARMCKVLVPDNKVRKSLVLDSTDYNTVVLDNIPLVLVWVVA